MHSGSVTSASNIPLQQMEQISQGKALYTTNCASCHAPIDTSSKLGRSVMQIRSAIQSIPQMNYLSQLQAKDLEAISAALVYEANGGGVEENPAGRLQYTCTPGVYSKTPLLKLTNREFRNSLNQILDGFSTGLKSDSQLVNLYNNLPLDVITDDRNTIKEQSQLVTQISTNSFFDTAYRAAQLVAGDTTGLTNYTGTSGCLAQATITQTCHRNFVRQLGSRAFRKPLSQIEGNALSDSFWDASLSKQNLLILTFAGIVQSPEFIYKVYNRGTAVPNQQNLLTLTNHEIATKVAFFLTGAPPDNDLRSAADAGQLTSPSQLSAQVDRLLALPGAQDMVQRLFRESYGYDVYDNFNFNSSYINGISTAGLQQAMNAELDSFFTQIVLSQEGSFNDLFTSRYANISNTSLRQIYGVSASGVMNLPTERSGFLNRAAMLTKRSGYQASPIKRGLKVLEHVLCVNVGAPPPSAPTSLPEYNGEILTTRGNTERTSEAAGSTCVGCHSRFNPLGYAFEVFDSFGRLRNSERVFDSSGNLLATLPINSQATTREMGLDPVSFTDAVDLSSEIGQSDKAMMCFAKHLKRFEARKGVSATDNCQMNQSLQSLYGEPQRPGSIKAAIKALVMSQEFVYWSY